MFLKMFYEVSNGSIYIAVRQPLHSLKFPSAKHELSVVTFCFVH